MTRRAVPITLFVLVKVHTEMESLIGKDTIQVVYKETGFKPD